MATTKKTAAKKAVKKAPAKKAAPKKRAYKRKPKVADVIDEAVSAVEIQGPIEESNAGAALQAEENAYEQMHKARQERYLRDADVLLIEGINIDGRVGLLGWLVSQNTKYINRNELHPVASVHFVNELLDPQSSNPVLGIKLGERGIVKLLRRGDPDLIEAKKAVQLERVNSEFSIEIGYVGEVAPSEIWHGGAFYSRAL